MKITLHEFEELIQTDETLADLYRRGRSFYVLLDDMLYTVYPLHWDKGYAGGTCLTNNQTGLTDVLR